MSDRQPDFYLDHLRKAKDARAVVKTEFASVASAIPESSKIFAYEGVDDKCVYYYWIKALAPGLVYEPYICRNKDNVLKLFDSLQADLTGLSARVYYFVDRDFDDLQGRDPHPTIFMTQRYSIENYLVSRQVLDDLLMITFHCEGLPLVRERILNRFDDSYSNFLDISSELNFRIYTAKKCAIPRAEEIPDRLSQFAVVELDASVLVAIPPSELIKLEREPTAEELSAAREPFAALHRQERYRGKFALLFFLRWLELLRGDRLSEAPKIFFDAPSPKTKIFGGFNLEYLAARAAHPVELMPFLSNVR